jgi:hypothetical protein
VEQAQSQAHVADTDPAHELSPKGKSLLQERLTTYGLVVTLVATGYFPAFYLTWHEHPGATDREVLAHIFSPWTFVLLAVHASPWVACHGRRLRRRWLQAIDVAVAAAVGVAYSGILLSHPSPAIAPLEGLLAIGSVLGMRALVVPSTGARTALAGTLLCAGPGLTLFGNAAHFSTSWMGVRTSGPLFITWSAVAILLTSVASRVLYGLRREVRDARRLGQYMLVEMLGEGGMGVVYRAKHALLRRPTAVKLLRSTQRLGSAARFEREVQLMAELNHPNTVQVYDYGRTSDGVFYYAMEYLDGLDLEGLVVIGGPQPAARVIHLMRQVCGSLDEAHRRGLIHRDIKPANLFLCRSRTEPDTIKVLDFGLVKDSSSDDTGLSSANVVLGTPLYMSPEAIAKPDGIDARSDIYSLGAVAYLLITGTPVFAGASMVEVCAKHLHREPEGLSARLGQPVPADLEAIVLACLAKSPEHRPESARALGDALAACTSAGGWGRLDVERWWLAHGSHVDARRSHAQRSLGHGQTLMVDSSSARPADGSAASSAPPAPP